MAPKASLARGLNQIGLRSLMRETLVNAVPGHTHQASLDLSAPGDRSGDSRERELSDFWGVRVPGSGVWDCVFVGAVASKNDLGFDIAASLPLLSAGLDAHENGDFTASVLLADQLLDSLTQAPRIEQHTAHAYRWSPMFRTHRTLPDRLPADWADRVRAGWLGQLAGAAFGAPFQACAGDAIGEVYGAVNRFAGPPGATNEIIGYQLAAVETLETVGRGVSAADFGGSWCDRIVAARKTEWVALDNLRSGVGAPRSAWHRNPMTEWSGAQSRSMVFGLIAPSWPLEAARLAQIEASVSHAGAGIESAAFGALVVSYAFLHQDPRAAVLAAAHELSSSRGEFAAVIRSCLDVCRRTTDSDVARIELLARFEDRYWDHSFPNIASVLVALWFGDGDFTRSMALVASSGLNTVGNAALVGTVLGVVNSSVPSWWSNPIKERMQSTRPDVATVTTVATGATVALESLVHQSCSVAETFRFDGR